MEGGYIVMSKTLNQVIDDLQARELKGLRSYGVTVDREDYGLLDWLTEAYEETLDNALYLKRAIDKEKERLNEKRTDIQKESTTID